VDVAAIEPARPGAYALDAFPVDLVSPGPVVVVGPAAIAVAEALARAGRRDVRAVTIQPSAAPVAALGAGRLAAGLTEDVASFEPDYVTPAYVAVSGNR
jgi:hypothetical protein